MPSQVIVRQGVIAFSNAQCMQPGAYSTTRPLRHVPRSVPQRHASAQPKPAWLRGRGVLHGEPLGGRRKAHRSPLPIAQQRIDRRTRERSLSEPYHERAGPPGQPSGLSQCSGAGSRPFTWRGSPRFRSCPKPASADGHAAWPWRPAIPSTAGGSSAPDAGGRQAPPARRPPRRPPGDERHSAKIGQPSRGRAGGFHSAPAVEPLGRRQDRRQKVPKGLELRPLHFELVAAVVVRIALLFQRRTRPVHRLQVAVVPPADAQPALGTCQGGPGGRRVSQPASAGSRGAMSPV